MTDRDSNDSTVRDPSPTTRSDEDRPEPEIPDYTLLRRLGRGGFGEVWLARSKLLGILYALKILPEGKLTDVELEGARSYARYSRSHPNLVQVFHLGRVSGRLYYIMELSDCYPTASPSDPAHSYKPRTLRSDLKRKGLFSLLEAVSVCRQLLAGLEYLHDRGLLHRDIKPENVIFVDDTPKLADIGLVVSQSDRKGSGGTAGYAPPGGVVDASGDLYSLGIVLWELLTGASPGRFPDLPDELSEKEVEAVGRISSLLDRACFRDPKDRLKSCEDFESELNKILGDEGLERVGPYKLIKPLGEGGSGVVYLAMRTTPMEQRVALKILRSGLDSKQVLARFEAERQALALMNHSNVARALDGGQTEDKRPFFAMEYVPGLRITEYCDRKRLQIRERLEIFTKVCDGLEHAHQKAIIHRDINPSNVLVMEEGGAAVPKIIDFGVAKATNRALTERTLFTKHDELIGTPDYMSPEQARQDVHEVDTRTDIYSLGALLYELLVGEGPFDRKRLGLANSLQVINAVQAEAERPEPPSARAARIPTAERALLARRMGTTPGVVIAELRRELDHIVLKTLSRKPEDRYASVSELRTDVKAYLRGEERLPVVGRKPERRPTTKSEFVSFGILAVAVVAEISVILFILERASLEALVLGVPIMVAFAFLVLSNLKLRAELLELRHRFGLNKRR